MCTALVIVVYDLSMDVSVVCNTIGVSSGVIIGTDTERSHEFPSTIIANVLTCWLIVLSPLVR